MSAVAVFRGAYFAGITTYSSFYGCRSLNFWFCNGLFYSQNIWSNWGGRHDWSPGNLFGRRTIGHQCHGVAALDDIEILQGIHADQHFCCSKKKRKRPITG